MLAGLNAAFSDEAINCYKQKTRRGGGRRDRLKHTAVSERRSFAAVGAYPVIRAHCWPGGWPRLCAYQASDDLLCLTQRGK